MRIVFMGSPEIAAISLRRLVATPTIDVAGVMTQPDRARGRGLQVEPCETRRIAMELGLPTYAASTINDAAGVDQLCVWAPELIAVVAFGQILRPAVLELPPFGCVNLHTSLLPALRGAAPIQWAIAEGRDSTGVTTMYMDRGMDNGDIIAQQEVDISPEDTGGSLHDKLAQVGAKLLAESLLAIGKGTAQRQRQDHEAATHARKLTKEDGRIDWTFDASSIHNRVRAFNPWPCCFCLLPDSSCKGIRLRVLASCPEAGCGLPGELLDVSGRGPLVACGQGAVRLLEVQPAGKKVMGGRDFLMGHELHVGETMQ